MEEAVRKVRKEVYEKIKELLQTVHKIPFHFSFKDGKHILAILNPSTKKARAVFVIERNDPWEILDALELLLTNIRPRLKAQPA